jgi:hypothetical protein
MMCGTVEDKYFTKDKVNRVLFEQYGTDPRIWKQDQKLNIYNFRKTDRRANQNVLNNVYQMAI